MAIGDSQAVGYGIPYGATFTALYAARQNRQSTIVAAPADDPGTEAWATGCSARIPCVRKRSTRFAARYTSTARRARRSAMPPQIRFLPVAPNVR
jgi:hypothetical protein